MTSGCVGAGRSTSRRLRRRFAAATSCCGCGGTPVPSSVPASSASWSSSPCSRRCSRRRRRRVSAYLDRLGGRCCPGPTADHWLGLDALGRDELSRIIYGARVSLIVAIVSVALALAAGALLGAVAGYFGGVVDSVVMRLVDVMLAFPSFLFAIGLVALLGPGLWQLMVAIGVSNVPIFARLLRGSMLGVRNMPYVASARVLGLPPRRVLLVHMLPERGVAADRGRDAGDGDGDHRDRRARLPRPREQRPEPARVGGDAREHDTVPADRAAPRVLPRRRHRAHRARLQPPRRRPARGHRPAAARDGAARGRGPGRPVPHVAERRARGERRRPHRRRRADRRGRRRVRERQVGDRAGGDGIARPRRDDSPRPGRVRRAVAARPARAPAAAAPRRRDVDDLPGSDDVSQPGDDHRCPGRRGARSAHPRCAAATRGADRSRCSTRSASPTRRVVPTTTRTSSPAGCGNER